MSAVVVVEIGDTSFQVHRLSFHEMSESALVADEDWEEKFSEQHQRKFWKNKKTGKSSWTEPPKVPKTASSAIPATATQATTSSETEMVADEDWEEKYSDQHKKKFWKNKKTGKSSWTEPPKVPKKSTGGGEAVTTEISSSTQDMVADEDWEEKYSEQHKKKFWKNKKTGKSSWTEPPKVPKSATSATTPATATQATTSSETEMVADEDWEEKYSDQHKKKFWKNKKTGKSSWTEPPKVPKKSTGGGETAKPALEEMVVDEDWEEKYSEPHKRKFWKNKKTGKSSWTEPPKVPRASKLTEESLKPAEVVIPANEKESKPAQAVTPAVKTVIPVCGVLWATVEGKFYSFPAKLISSAESVDGTGSLLLLYKEYPACSYSISPVEQELLKDASTNNKQSNEAKESTAIAQQSASLLHLILPLDCYSQLYCNESPGCLRFVKRASVSNSQQEAPSASNQETNGGLIAKDSQQKESLNSAIICTSETHALLPDVVLRCSSRSEANLWVNIFRTRVPRLEITDSSETCLGDIDRVEMACVIAGADHDRARAEIEWLRGLSQTYTVSSLQEEAIKHLKLVEQKVDHLLERSSENSDSLSSNQLPVEGLVVVALMPSSELNWSEGGEYSHHRGSLACFTGQSLSLWIQLDDQSRRLVFYDHGPTNEPCFSLSLPSNARIIITDISFEHNYLFEIQHCLPLLETVGQQTVTVNLTFSFSSSVEYWKWALSLANFLQISSRANYSSESSRDKSPSGTGSIFSKFPLLLPQATRLPIHSNRLLKWNNFMLDFAMDSIDTITDRIMVRRFLKKFTITGSEIRSMKFYSVHHRIVISDPGRTPLRLGSVLITLNQISAIGIPGRSITEIIQEIPTHATVDLHCWEFPREIFACAVLPSRSTLRSSELRKMRVVEGTRGEEEKKADEAENENKTTTASSDDQQWLTNVRAKLEGDTLSLSHKTWRQSFNLTNVRMRLIEVDELNQGSPIVSQVRPTIALFVAVELRDKDSQVLVGCSTLRSLLEFLCCIFEALKLVGTIGYDLTKFHDRCLQYQRLSASQLSNSLSLRPESEKGSVFQEGMSLGALSNLTLTPIHRPLRGDNRYDTPTMQTPLNDSRVFQPSSRSDIMRAAHDLEAVFESLHITEAFPTVKHVHEVRRLSPTLHTLIPLTKYSC
jgi:hypothetical protein